ATSYNQDIGTCFSFVYGLEETMFVIATRLISLFAIAYLFGLLVAWLFSLFNSDGGDDDFREGDPDTPQPPDPGKALSLNQDLGRKRLVEVDESYYLEEFDLSKK
ncbi:MAG: hypothetical protein AAFR62_05940, partial [Cyanobacteria bacterium J06629_2]